MKLWFSIFLICIYCQVTAQQTADEKELRTNGDYTSFLKEVKKNSTANCLCKQNEYVIFSFATRNNKIASLCISKKVTKSSGYIIYRFGTKNKIELAYPSDTLNSFSAFTFSHYSRGGGKQNLALELNEIEFSNQGIIYTIHDDWSSESNSFERGIRVLNNETNKLLSIDVKGKPIGNLYIFRDYNLVEFSETTRY